MSKWMTDTFWNAKLYTDPMLREIVDEKTREAQLERMLVHPDLKWYVEDLTGIYIPSEDP